MRIVKLTAAALRQWRANVPHLVDNDGKIVRSISTFEDTAIAQLMRETKARKKGFERTIRVNQEGGKTAEVQIVTTYERRGRTDNDCLTTVSIDGHQYKTGRELLCAQLFEAYGECQIRGPNGVVLKFVRDASLKRPSFKDSLLVATHPDFCECRNWGQPHEGTHYPTCPQNRIAPPEHQAIKPPTEDELRTLPSAAFASLARPNAAGVVHSTPMHTVREEEEVKAPKDCKNGCLEWAIPSGKTLEDGQHHPMCYFYDKWKIKTVQGKQFWLIDVTTGEKVRRATTQEAGEAEIIQARTGNAIIQIDDVPYGVVDAKDLEQDEEVEVSSLPIEPGVARRTLQTADLVAHQSGIR